MPRRSHKKSRQGCQECKRRHLKCDETKPKCINCVTAHIRCPYEATKHIFVDAPTPPEDSQQGTHVSATSTPSRSPSSFSFSNYTSPSSTDTSLNMVHLELLYSWSTGIYKSFLVSSERPEIYADTCIKYGLKFPFLMRQILATSALHLSIIRPEQRQFYHQHAQQLQTEALAGFSTVVERLDETNVLPAFLVSSLIGLHAFCETFVFRNDNFNDTLDAVLSSINLLRGIRLVIGSWWEYLRQSELKPILDRASAKRAESKHQQDYLADLETLISHADIGEASMKTYQEAIEELRNLFASQATLTEDEGHQANMVFAWPVTVPSGYIDLLSARRPEALIVLAYYAAVLHVRRDFWAVGDAGKYLIDAIGAHLGKHWDEWLAWPRSILASTT